MQNVVVFAGNDCLVEKQNYYFSLAYKTGALLAQNGFTTVSGGGPGLMDESMRGAFQNGGKTIAVCLEVEGRKQTKFASEKLIFKVLNERQNKLINFGDAFIALPGGVGTLYEIFAILALKRKGEILNNRPMILVDSYFDLLIPFLNKMMKEGFIDNSLNNHYKFVSTAEEAIAIIKNQ